MKLIFRCHTVDEPDTDVQWECQVIQPNFDRDVVLSVGFGRSREEAEHNALCIVTHFYISLGAFLLEHGWDKVRQDEVSGG